MNRDAMMVLRIPSPLKDALKRAADADLRTMSSMAVRILADFLTAQGHLDAKALNPKPTKSKRR